ncbi:MAG: hypothetical protein HN904_16195 [Victivallales bacterium]|nr:hypothetical protein [Victivallales bacterium]
MSALRSLLVVGALLAGTARGQTARVGSGGGLAISYGGMDTFLGDSVLLMDEKWQALDSPLRAKPKVTRTTGKVVATYESPLGQVVRTVVSGPPVVVTWEVELKPDPKGRNLELTVRVPREGFDSLPVTEETHDVQRSRERLAFSGLAGEWELDVSGSTVPWSFDDMRNVEWAKTFRLRVAPPYDPAKGWKGTQRIAFTAKPSRAAAFLPLGVAKVGNRGLRDEVADDGKGGWTDQGENDLRQFEAGRHTFLGMPYEVGEKVIVLRGTERPAFPSESATISVGAKVERVGFLHTAAWSAKRGEEIAEYLVSYTDDTTARVPVRYGFDVRDWWGATEPGVGRLAWEGANGQTQVGVYLALWRNPQPEKVVRNVQMRSLNRGSVPILLAATAVRAEALTREQTTLLDQVYADRSDKPLDMTDWSACPIAWRDGIETGTALDASFLNQGPAGTMGFLKVRDGHFVFTKKPTKRVRFWGTNAALRGPFPVKEDAPGIARALARQGVNMVRLHLYAVYDDTLIAPDGTLDPKRLDQMEFFIAELKKNGIYSYMDLNDGMLFSRLVGRKLPTEKLKLAALFDEELILATQKLARMLFTHKNPYTGLRLCDDPGIALYEITNECSLTMSWGTLRSRLPSPYYEQLEKRWQEWLGRQGLAKRELPDTLAKDGPEGRRFAAEMQKAYLERMKAFLVGLGVKAPICGTNITFTLGDLWASENMDYMNDHAYAAHPNVRARPMTYSNHSAVRSGITGLSMIPSFARAKLKGKPVVASEWNYCFPNDFRCEGLPFMTAYSAYQDWDALLFYCATGSFDSGTWLRFRDKPGILVHSQQTDPATWGLSQLCAIAYRRGDIGVAKRTIRVRYGMDRVWENESVVDSLRFLPGLGRVEIELGPETPAEWPMVRPEGQTGSAAYLDAIKRLGAKDCTESVMMTDTGEIRRDTGRDLLVVNTPRTQMVTGNLPALADMGEVMGVLAPRVLTPFATVGATSLDGLPLAESNRVLLVAVANARNADTKCLRGELHDMGKGPVMAEPVCGTVGWRSMRPEDYVIHALDPLSGRRKACVPTVTGLGALEFPIGAHGTIYYEIVAE